MGYDDCWQCELRDMESRRTTLFHFLGPTRIPIDNPNPTRYDAESVSVRGRKMANRPIGIDLFAGAGGLSLGFEQAGFDIVAAVEIDPIHAAVHKFNFPHCAVLARSVEGLTAREIRQAAGIGRSKVHTVFGGAPCQGFSLIGHRVLDDPRNHLVREFVRLVAELQADYFVFENVKGLTLGKHRQFLDEFIRAFEEVGYAVRQPWRVLNAANYGVPQNRERLILFGAKRGLELPDYPEPECSPAGKRTAGLPSGPSCRDAIGDLPDAEDFYELMTSDCVQAKKWKKASPYAAELRCQSPDAWHFGYGRKWNPRLLTSSVRTTTPTFPGVDFTKRNPVRSNPFSRFFKLSPNGICNTLRAGTDAARGAFTSPRPIHYEKDRCITIREMARLHGFPDWFRFHGTKWHGARQIGNAVPPPLARAIASAVRRASNRKPSRPKNQVELGNTTLLTMDISQAAEFWNVPATGRRDKKSGAKKRKQIDIEAERIAALVPPAPKRRPKHEPLDKESFAHA